MLVTSRPTFFDLHVYLSLCGFLFCDSYTRLKIVYFSREFNINEEVPDGWVLGGIKGRKHKPRVDTEPTIVITDGISTRRIKISEQIPDGWRRGRHYSPNKK